MLNVSGERGHPCLVPDLTGKALNLSTLSGLLWFFTFYYVKVVSSFPILLCSYNERVLNFVHSFSASIGMITFLLHFIVVAYYTGWFLYADPSLHSKNKNPTWSWCVICCLMMFPSILWRTSPTMIMGILVCRFFFFYSVIGFGVSIVSEWVRKHSLLNFFGKLWEGLVLVLP